MRFPGSDLGVERFGRRRLRPAKGVRVSRSSKGPSRRMPGIPGFRGLQVRFQDEVALGGGVQAGAAGQEGSAGAGAQRPGETIPEPRGDQIRVAHTGGRPTPRSRSSLGTRLPFRLPPLTTPDHDRVPHRFQAAWRASRDLQRGGPRPRRVALALRRGSRGVGHRPESRIRRRESRRAFLALLFFANARAWSRHAGGVNREDAELLASACDAVFATQELGVMNPEEEGLQRGYGSSRSPSMRRGASSRSRRWPSPSSRFWGGTIATADGRESRWRRPWRRRCSG